MVLERNYALNQVLISTCKSARAFVHQKNANTKRNGTRFFVLAAVFQSFALQNFSSMTQIAVANASLKYVKLDSTGIKKTANVRV